MSVKTKIEKIQKEFPDFTLEAESMSVQALENRMLTYAKELEATKAAEAIDAEDMSEKGLGFAKELAKERSAPYRDAKKAIGAKMTYIAHLIGEKGGNI